jgi:hypothetical protein
MKCDVCISPTECDGNVCLSTITPVSKQPLIYRLRKRAEIRRSNDQRLSVKEGKPDRISDLLEEAADRLEKLNYKVN